MRICPKDCTCGRHGRKKTVPVCHPDRKHGAFGLCVECYQEAYRLEHCVERIADRHGIADLDGVRRALRQRYCSICHRTYDLHVDHNHKTGKVRERLCGRCNRGIGMFSDSPGLLREAALYLERLTP